MIGAVDSEGGGATVLFGIAEALRRQGRPTDAAKWFHQALADNPQHAPSLHRLGNARKALGQWVEAERAYRLAAVLTHDNAELFRQHANVLKDLERPKEAETLCLTALAMHPDDETLLFALAVILSEPFQSERAREALRKAIAVRPDCAPALHRYGTILKDEGAVHEAMAAFRRSLFSDPWQSATFHRVGMGWRELGWEDLAAAAYRRAIALDPCNAEALCEFGNLVRSRGDLEAAVDLHRFATLADPVSVKPKVGLSVVEAQRGNMDSALPLWCDAVGLANIPPSENRSDAGSYPIFPAIPISVPRNTAPITVATSLMPRRIDAQQAAVSSWHAFGFDVISVNTAAEIERLKPLFPAVHFEQADRTAEDICGKPLVFLDTCLHALNRSGAAVCGIINSDIVLHGGRAEAMTLASQARGRLLFGSRINVATLQSKTGWIFASGYDYFLFDRSIIRCFAGSDMVIGAPWWDYWVPLATALSGFPIAMVHDLRALHCTHPVGYSKQLYLDFGERLLAASAELIGRSDGKIDHALTAFAARALPIPASACASGAWSLSPKTVFPLARLVLDIVSTVALPLAITPASVWHAEVRRPPSWE